MFVQVYQSSGNGQAQEKPPPIDVVMTIFECNNVK